MVKNGNFDDAATSFDEQSIYFANPKNRKENSATLSRIAAHFNDPIAGAVTQNLTALRAVRWPLPAKEWAKTKSNITASRNATSGYPDLAILRDPDFRLDEVDSLSNEALRVTNLLKANVNAAIAGFDHFGEKPFFDAYPVPVNPRQAFGDNFDAFAAKLDKATASELKRFIAHYPPNSSLSIALYDRASRAYRKHLVADQVKVAAPSLIKLFSVLRKLKKDGFQTTGDEEGKIGFVEVTSKTLLREGQIDYPIEIDADVSITPIQSTLDEALTDPDGPKYLLIIDVALAETSRRVLEIKKMPSKVLTGYNEETNPQYNIVQNEINNARLGLQQASTKN